MSSRVLLISTCRFLGPARLASAFLNIGSQVNAVCSAQDTIRSVKGMATIYPWRPLAPERCLEAAILAARPDLLVSCDDVATLNLHRVFERSKRSGAADTCNLIERSLGDSRYYSITTSRTGLMTVARDHGIRVPENACIDGHDTLWRWLNEHGVPSVLKADHTAGGWGVRLLSNVSDSEAAWQGLSSPLSPIRALKRVMINGDANDVLSVISKSRNAISVQRFIVGQDANATVACRDGQVLACIAATVSKTSTAFGPATVLKIVDHPEISSVVSTLVAALGLSGFIGFDFVIEQGSGDVYLIEMNPRVTQLCHLALGHERDLTAALQASYSNRPCVPRPQVTDKDLIALFPQEVQRDPSSEFVSAAYHDVPWDEPDLIRASTETNWRIRLWDRISATLGTQSSRDFA
jgi:carbamoylphosphate synthase large subunit